MRLVRGKAWFWLIIPVTILIAIASYRITVKRKVDQALRDIKAAGYPSTLVELDKSYTFVPANENAALRFIDNYRAIWPARNNHDLPVVGNRDLPPLGEPLPETMAAAIRKHLEANRQSLEAIDENMKLPRSRYPVDLTAGASLLLPYLAETKSAAQILKLQAIFAADEGNGNLAARDIVDQIAVANTLHDEPILISQLVRIAILRIAVSTLENVLYKVDLGSEDLQRISNLLQRADQDQAATFKTGMVGERCFGMDWFQKYTPALDGQLGKSEPRFPIPTILAVRGLVGLWDADRLYFLNFMTRFISVADLPLPEALDANAALFAELEKNRQRYYISSTLLPAMEGAFTKSVETSAALRTAQVGLAIRERIASGTLFSNDLQALASSDLKIDDPFTRKPLLTLHTNHSLLIYSVGRDRIDNHGHRPGKEFPTNNDIVFEIRAEAIPRR